MVYSLTHNRSKFVRSSAHPPALTEKQGGQNGLKFYEAVLKRILFDIYRVF
jgi:hypothetical protein